MQFIKPKYRARADAWDKKGITVTKEHGPLGHYFTVAKNLVIVAGFGGGTERDANRRAFKHADKLAGFKP